MWGYLHNVHTLSSMTIMDANSEPVYNGRVVCSVSLALFSLPQVEVLAVCDSYAMNWPLVAHCDQYCEHSWCIAWYTDHCYLESDNHCTCPALDFQRSYEVDLHGYLRLMNTGNHVCQQNTNVCLRFCAPAWDFCIS